LRGIARPGPVTLTCGAARAAFPRRRFIMDTTPSNRSHHREPWNKGKLTGQKAQFKPKDV
jgi:hypothetical protein